MFLGFCILLVAAQVTLPRRYAFLPLVVAACHLGNVEIVANLTIARLLIVVGLARSALQGDLRLSFRHPLDALMMVFSALTLLSSFAHGSADGNPFIARAGLVLNVAGTYFYGRAYLRDLDDLRRYAAILPLILLPLAVMMAAEKRTGENYYRAAGLSAHAGSVREDKIRATGAFRSPILAGTAGATSLPLILLLWRRRPALATAGVITCGAIVYASSSSGPLAAAAFGTGVVLLWRWRHRLRAFQLAAIAALLVLAVVMNRPIWYIMASIDLVGGSTGWHRARLMDQGWNYLHEWWLFGTDYTRHWMSTGVSWSPNHIDLTNYYLHLGVIGGIALPLCLVAMLFIAFRKIGNLLSVMDDSDDRKFFVWGIGATLAAHALSFVSISYFDQMYVLFYLLLAAVPGVAAAILSERPSDGEQQLT